jgi:hypothetical protein
MERTVSGASRMRYTNNTDREGDHLLATSGEYITAVRVLTFPKLRMPMYGEGIGSTRAFRFRRNIMYTETRTDLSRI